MVRERTVEGARPMFEPLEEMILLNASWSATPVTLNSSQQASVVSQTLNPTTEPDWYSFQAPYGTTGTVQAGITSVSGGLRGHVGIYDSVIGTLADQFPSIYSALYGAKAQVDASSGNQSVSTNWAGMNAGQTYYVKVSGLAGTTGSFTLNLTAVMLGNDAYETNDSSGAASNITSALVSGSGALTINSLNIRNSSDVDWFRVNTPSNADGNLVATVSNLSGGLAGMVQIYQQFGSVLAPVTGAPFASWTGGSGAATLYTTQPSTSYWIQVSGFAPSTGGYRLSVNLPLAAQSKDVYESAGLGNGQPWLATPLTLDGGSISLTNLSIYKTGYNEWFSFIAPPGSGGSAHIQISGASPGLIASATLYAGSPYVTGTTLTASGGGGAVNLNVSGVTPGMMYYVKVTGASNTTGWYNMTVSTDMPNAIRVADYFPIVPGNNWSVSGDAYVYGMPYPMSFSTSVGANQWISSIGATAMPVTFSASLDGMSIPIIIYATQNSSGTNYLGMSFSGLSFLGASVNSLTLPFPTPLHVPALVALPQSTSYAGTFGGSYGSGSMNGFVSESLLVDPNWSAYVAGAWRRAIRFNMSFTLIANTSSGTLLVSGNEDIYMCQGYGIVVVNGTNTVTAFGLTIPVSMNLSYG